jgi:hypothetical protein
LHSKTHGVELKWEIILKLLFSLPPSLIIGFLLKGMGEVTFPLHQSFCIDMG